MINGIIGRKSQTQLFALMVAPVTVTRRACIVVQKKSARPDGYNAVHLGL